jgi:hypothetical protein
MRATAFEPSWDIPRTENFTMKTRTKRFTILSAGLAGLLALAPAARAADPTYRLGGTVARVDPAKNQITLDGLKNKALVVTDQTQIIDRRGGGAGHPMKFSDVKEGDVVRAIYNQSSDSGSTVKVSRLLIVTPDYSDEG